MRIRRWWILHPVFQEPGEDVPVSPQNNSRRDTGHCWRGRQGHYYRVMVRRDVFNHIHGQLSLQVPTEKNIQDVWRGDEPRRVIGRLIRCNYSQVTPISVNPQRLTLGGRHSAVPSDVFCVEVSPTNTVTCGVNRASRPAGSNASPGDTYTA